MAKTIFKTFEEKTPLDCDVLDSMVTKLKPDLKNS